MYFAAWENEEPPGRPTEKYDEGRLVIHWGGSRSLDRTPYEHGHFQGTYQPWLKAQLDKDPQCIIQVLDKTRFELFKAGKLELKEMATAGKIMRLSEFYSLMTTAMKTAGRASFAPTTNQRVTSKGVTPFSWWTQNPGTNKL